MFHRKKGAILVMVGILVFSVLFLSSNPVFAQACNRDGDCAPGEICTEGQCVDDGIIPIDEEPEDAGMEFEQEDFDNAADRASELKATRKGLKAKIKKLDPIKTTPQVLIGRVIKAALGISGSIALVIIIYSGVMWMLARGKADLASKSKDTIIWAVFGLAVIFASYAIADFVIKAVQVN